MKIKDFLEDFKDFDPESELKFELFEDVFVSYSESEEVYTDIDVVDIDYSKEDKAVSVTLGY
ncbi:hypothetical protein [Anaerococcus marasmi]|uniref:hypothetical protein n=1 Tax=Anaerococcus marasmi TaxID=2057797 RepID=UPI000CF913CC|nr:hypothetical protein [Anaerococcus marasmi]